MSGKVYIAGAGPGDPELLTRKVEKLFHSVDVMLYDRLVSDAILELVPSGVARIYAGKSCKQHAMTQQEINQSLVQLAKSGHRVLRLKGGDPFIFGRGGEEAEALAAAGIAFEIIPGVSAASGCSAYAGIPLTHRDHAQSVCYVTGHLKQESLDGLDWQALGAKDMTVVVYMGLANAEAVKNKLIAHGRSPHTAFAVIENGTLPEQRVLRGTLHDLPDILAHEAVQSPSLLIIGEVTALSDRLSWFGMEAASDGASRKVSR
jgi:uroporphyrin-III C-methyltransferase / precorrin-2 dehydrogenase / sirohydrochlorin ferrochelatase